MTGASAFGGSAGADAEPPTVYVLNGPNLGRLGSRETDVYGAGSYADLVRLCEETAVSLGMRAVVRQTDAEHELIGWLHRAADEAAPVVLNPAAWSHYSYAVRDACAMLRAPLIEVHLSNIHAREPFRHHSVVSAVATGVICGLGPDGYRWALCQLARGPGAADAPSGPRSGHAG